MTTTGNNDNELLKISEVADLLRVSHDVVTKLINTGQLPALHITPKVVRIRKADLDAFLESCRGSDFNTP